ncbi:transcriptional regulator [Parafrankia colletiae]|uniref:Transcriptional regulator n=1 Tax=Parafrankia colletiae TaxID=573497 RepID=A0A1S1QHN8_9ACTN|nr:TetR/AcrR family transcriptional regulator [Parafrankia colletiae]MCK9899926.1 TetR/AcrR family transcriptional regulator [Frankia sp. Cpl3]OHV34283.1 transcriptional regulator [Parafrankia colletiae]
MSAALDLFVRQGYAATTLEDVAAATPVSRQTVYNHFGDKETLFLSAIDEHLTATLGTLREATAHFPSDLPDPEVYLNELARRIMATFLHPRTAALRLLLQTEGPRHPQLMQLWRQRVATPVWSELIGQLARLAHGGVLSIDDPARAAGHFIALVNGTVWEMTELGTFAVHTPPTIDDPALDTALRSAVGLFVRGYARRAP